MNNRRLYTLGLVLGIALLQGCASTSTTELPPPEPPPPEPPRSQPAPPPAEPAGPSQTALAALDEAAARAEKERRQAEDFGAPDCFPEDWESAEAAYQAISPDRTSPQGAAEAERLYNEAADRYRDIFRRTAERYVEEYGEEMARARSEAIAAGIAERGPEYLDKADQAAGAVQDHLDAEDYYKAVEAGREALNRYRSLAAGAEALSLREEIIRRDFARFDPDNFSQGDDAFDAALAAYEEGRAEEALKGASESKLRFTGVLRTGWAAYAAQLRTLAQRERQNALNAKADAAVKDDFAATEGIFTRAESAYRAESYENAVDLYVESEAGYAALVLAAEEKRRIAQAAIDAAEKKLAESESVALKAEAILGDEGDME
ncbi:MAG: hypothetical protein LBH51_10280 [Treponema sp.]|nr:hypothetical protein [Treponema sp.]